MSVNIYDKETGKLIQIAGNANGGGSIDDVNVSNKTTYSSEKIEEKIKTLKPTQDIKYEGIDVTCENTLDGKVSDVVITGKTYHNLFRRINSQTTQEQDNNYILSGVADIYSMLSIYPAYNLQKNNKYTVIIDVKNINVVDGKQFKFDGFNGNTWVCGSKIETTGLQKIILQGTQDITEIRLQINNGVNCNITISKNIIILEGDWTNKEVPASITGIESVGQNENKISILSKNNKSADVINYKQDKKEILLPVEGGLKSLPNGVYDTIEQRADGVYLVQKVGKYDIKEDDGITIDSSPNQNNTIAFVVNVNATNIKTVVDNICNNFNHFTSGDLYWNSDIEGILNSSNSQFKFRILKSKLSTQDIAGIKAWLKANPTTVCYEINTPVETKLDINNLDLEVYKYATYVTTDNAIKPTLSFKVSSNIDIDVVIKELNDKIVKNKNQYCYTHGCKFEVEKHFNIFNLNSLKPGNSFNSIYWPWIIRVDDKLDNPLGKYYLYYSTDHAMTAGGIGLAYSNNILDGFTDYGKIYQNGNKETETPSVIYDYKNKKFIIYFHSLATYEGEHQTSWRILSDDGINFDNSTLKKAFDLNHNELIGDLHNGYLHPFNIGDTYYAYSLMGGGDNCTSAFHISEDGGYTWKTDYKQMGAWGYKPENNTLLNPYHGTVIQKYGIFWWVGSRTNFTSGSNPKTRSSIDIVPLNDFTHPAAKSSVLISFDNEEYESNNIRQCTCFYDEGNIYILYQCDNIFNCAILK